METAQAGNSADLLDGLIARARRLGADAADAVMLRGSALDASCRLGEPEEVVRSEVRSLGLRVFAGNRQAIVSTTDFSQGALGPLAEQAMAMARAVPEDPYAGLADPALLSRDWPALDLVDTAEPDAESLMARALAAAGGDSGHQRRLRRLQRIRQPLRQCGGARRRRHGDGA